MKKITRLIIAVTMAFFVGCGGGGGGSGSSVTVLSDEQLSKIPCENIRGICVADTFGSAQDNAFMVAAHKDAQNFFEFNSVFGPYKENPPEAVNAFATDTNPNFIFFGIYYLNLLKKTAGKNWHTVVEGVISHEYGHIVQFNTLITEDMLKQRVNVGSTVVLSELEADAFSGFYMYFKLQSKSQIESYFKDVENSGDNAFTAADHHGTSEQRKQAAAYGILSADYIIKNNLQDSINWVTLRVAFLKGIAQYILYDVDYVTFKEKLPFGITPEDIETIRDIGKGEKTLEDLRVK